MTSAAGNMSTHSTYWARMRSPAQRPSVLIGMTADRPVMKNAAPVVADVTAMAMTARLSVHDRRSTRSSACAAPSATPAWCHESARMNASSAPMPSTRNTLSTWRVEKKVTRQTTE